MRMLNVILNFYYNSPPSMCSLKIFLVSHTPGGLDSHTKGKGKEKKMECRKGEAREKRRVMGRRKGEDKEKEEGNEQWTKKWKGGIVMK